MGHARLASGPSNSSRQLEVLLYLITQKVKIVCEPETEELWLFLREEGVGANCFPVWWLGLVGGWVDDKDAAG